MGTRAEYKRRRSRRKKGARCKSCGGAANAAAIVLIVLMMTVLGCSPIEVEEQSTGTPQDINDAAIAEQQEELYDLTTEEGRRMASNRATIIENVPMVDFEMNQLGKKNIDFIIDALERMGIGNILDITNEYLPAKPPHYGEMERVSVTFTDDLGNTFYMHVDLYGYVYSMHKIDRDGAFWTSGVVIPIA